VRWNNVYAEGIAPGAAGSIVARFLTRLVDLAQGGQAFGFDFLVDSLAQCHVECGIGLSQWLTQVAEIVALIELIPTVGQDTAATAGPPGSRAF